MLCLLAICIWILCKPEANERPKILIMILGLLLFVPISQLIMDAESRGTPLKFDYFLYSIDSSLGVSAFSVARLFSERTRAALFTVYNTLSFTMLLWYAVHLHLEARRGNAKHFLNACLVAYLGAPLLYLVVPARGPGYAFGSMFPSGSPAVHAALIPLDGWPNAMPSLHVTTALLLVILAPKIRSLQFVSWMYLAATVGATLAFEHYVIDLIVAVPYACFAVSLATGNYQAVLRNSILVGAWLLAIRFATPALVGYPPLLRLIAVGTVAIALSSLRPRVSSPVESPVPVSLAAEVTEA